MRDALDHSDARLALVAATLPLAIRTDALDDPDARRSRGIPAPRQLRDDAAQHARARVPALPDGVDGDGAGAAEDPDNGDGDPAGEEGLGEDVAGAVHWHGPEDEQGEGQAERDPARDAAGAGEHVRLGGFGGVVGRVWGGGDSGGGGADAGGADNGRVVCLADLAHADPVVALRAGEEGEEGAEKAGGEEGDDVAGEHGVVCARAGDAELAVQLLCRHEPGCERAGQAERRGEGGGEAGLVAPEKG